MLQSKTDVGVSLAQRNPRISMDWFFDDDLPETPAEARADAEAARMDLLIDRIRARLDREGLGAEAFYRVMNEERRRLATERGELPLPSLPPEEEAERLAWLEQMNAAADEALERYQLEDEASDFQNPLVLRCSEFSVRLEDEIEASNWLPEHVQPEHPLTEIAAGTMIAAAKLAGALGTAATAWPPKAALAGDVLVRLKKARSHLRDAWAGLESADQERLATAEWRTRTRTELSAILQEVEARIAAVRAILREGV